MTAPRLLIGIRDAISYTVETLASLLQNILDIRTQLNRMEKNMATKAQIETALNDLKAAVTTKVQAVSDQLATLTTSFNEFKAEDTTEDAAFTQKIADLEAQLASATSLTDEALAAINATTASVSGAPAPEAPTVPTGAGGVS